MKKLIALSLLGLSVSALAEPSTTTGIDDVSCSFHNKAVKLENFLAKAKPNEKAICQTAKVKGKTVQLQIKIIANGTCEHHDACRAAEFKNISNPASHEVLSIISKDKNGNLKVELGSSEQLTFIFPDTKDLALNTQA